MWRGRPGIVIIGAVITLLTACAGSATPTATQPELPAPTATVSPTTTPPVPVATPGVAATPGTPGTAGVWPPIVQLAIAALASEARMPATDIRVVRANPHEWPDTSLGCPQPGRVYLDVITPGYLIILEAHGRQFEYHTDRLRGVVHCDSNQPGATPGTSEGTHTPMSDLPNPVRLAIAALADDRQLATSAIEVVAIEPTEWPNSSLGCPQPGRAYLQIITPGYRVVLAAGGQQYEYHTNNRDMVVRC
jgi:hypothetical protein